MARIFISHSSKNNFPAIALRDWIINGGWDDHPFLDLDPERGITAGECWSKSRKATWGARYRERFPTPAWSKTLACVEALCAGTRRPRV
jgi:hypothetical protein